MKNIEIKEIKSNKKLFLPLLLEGDEEEKMIDRYIDECRVFAAIYNKSAIGIIAFLDCGNKIAEIKNIAVDKQHRRNGIGRTLIKHIENLLKNDFDIIQVGTGESPLTVPFYEKCGFEYSHRIKNFFTDNYEKPIVEEGILLRDMIYLRKKLK